MLERAVVLMFVAVVLMSALASTLPKLLPTLTVLGVLVLIGRWVWWYTR